MGAVQDSARAKRTLQRGAHASCRRSAPRSTRGHGARGRGCGNGVTWDAFAYSASKTRVNAGAQKISTAVVIGRIGCGIFGRPERANSSALAQILGHAVRGRLGVVPRHLIEGGVQEQGRIGYKERPRQSCNFTSLWRQRERFP